MEEERRLASGAKSFVVEADGGRGSAQFAGVARKPNYCVTTIHIREEMPGMPHRAGCRGRDSHSREAGNPGPVAQPCALLACSAPYAAMRLMSQRRYKEFA